jgi:SlyX protein
MTEIETLAQRIDALEVHIAHQDQTIEDLNTALTGQWKQIEHIAYRLGRLTDEMRAVESRGSDEPEPPPPHY